MSQKTLSHQFFSAALWNSLLLPARVLVGAFASVLYYQFLSVDQVGVLFLLTSLATTLGIYADLGIERTLPRFLPEVEQRAGRKGVERLMSRVIRLKLMILLMLIAVLAGFASPLSRGLASRQRKELAVMEGQLQRGDLGPQEKASLAASAESKRRISSDIESQGPLFLGAVGLLLLLGALFDVNMQFLTSYLRQRSWNLITLASTLLQPVLVSLFIWAGWGIGGVLIGMVSAPLACVVLARTQVRRASRELKKADGGGELDADIAGRFARFSAVSFLMQATAWLYDLQFVVLLSSAVLTLRDAVILGFSYKFTKDILGYVWTPLSGVILPVLSRVHARGDGVALQEAHAALTRIVWLLVLPAAVGVVVIAPQILQVLYPKYVETAELIMVFVVFNFGETLLGVPQIVLMTAEEYRPVVVAQLMAILTVPLVWFLLPQGLMGVAVAVGAVRVLTRGLTVVEGVRRLGLILPVRFMTRVGAAAGVMGGAVLLLKTLVAGSALSPGWRGSLILLALTSSGALVFVGALKALGGLHEEDRRRLMAQSFPVTRLLGRAL